MRRVILTVAGAAALALSCTLTSGVAQAAIIGPSSAMHGAADNLNMMETVQYMYEGRRHCWYPRGWRGPGWYWCGYAFRTGFGWGGGEGWQNWRREERREEWRGERREERRERRF